MWEEILRDYDAAHAGNERDEIAWSQEQPSLRRAIEIAAHATNARGRRYSHQYRIRREAIAQATAALLAAETSIKSAASFDEIHGVVSSQLRDVDGVGPVYLYDTAFRIGAHLGLFPTRVYLHAGTREGARVLGLPFRNDALEMEQIPEPLRHRAAHEVEDILCIYKDQFRGGAIPATGCGPKPSRRRRVC